MSFTDTKIWTSRFPAGFPSVGSFSLFIENFDSLITPEAAAVILHCEPFPAFFKAFASRFLSSSSTVAKHLFSIRSEENKPC